MSLLLPEEITIEPVLGFSPSTLCRLLDLSIPALARDRATGCLGSIPFVKIGRKVIYPKFAVQEWLNANLKHGIFTSQPSVPRLPGRPKGSTKSLIKARRNQSEKNIISNSEKVGK